MTLTAGTSLGPYEVVAPLGAGGMGEVYRARDPRLGREVAIKVLPEALADDSSRLGRFEREAKATGALNHPNILAIHDIGEHERRPFVVYELLEGHTLGERMREGPLPPHEALTWAMQVAQGLAAAHAKGIVHRDLKPENMFLTRDGVLKILDFGLAKLVLPELEDDAEIDREGETRTRDALTTEGAVLGTVGYMSPEQVKGQRADHRADIFSLGVVLYEMLSGRRPFQGGSVPETLASILKEDPPALPEGEISPPIAEVVGRCLEKAPDARFQSAHDLALALEVLAASVTELQPGVAGSGATGTTDRWGRRLALLAAGLVVAAGLAAGLWAVLAPSGPPRLVNLTQLTTDGVERGVLSTDGQRLYYTTPEGRLLQMPASGGASVEIDPWGDEGVKTYGAFVSPADPTQLLVGRYDGPGRWLGPVPPLPLWMLTLPAATPRRLGEVTISSGAWSPDGEQVAFGRDHEIYVTDKEGESPRKIFVAETWAFVSDWSVDDRIAYVLWYLLPEGGYRFELWQMKPDGSERHRLAPDWPGSSFLYARWTPDARYLIFVSGSLFGGEIWALETGATEPVPLATGVECGDLALGPRGRRLYADCAKRRSETFVYRPKIGEWAPYDFAPDASAQQIAWSPDGEWVTWIRFPEGTLWCGRRDGTRKLRLTEPGGYGVTMPRWSPDGRWVSFTRATKEGLAIRAFVVSRDGQGMRPVTEDAYVQDATAWTPDGRVVVSSLSQADGERALRVVDLQTGGWEELPGTEGYAGVSSSQDGRLLVAHEWEGSSINVNSTQVHLFDWETREWRALPVVAGALLQWSADARYVYYACGAQTSCRIHLDTNEVETVADASTLEAVSFWTSVDPDGRIIGQRTLSAFDIYAWDVEYR